MATATKTKRVHGGDPNAEFLTVEGAAAVAQISKQSLWNLRNRGKFPQGHQTSAGGRRFRRDDVIAWCEGTWQPEEANQ